MNLACSSKFIDHASRLDDSVVYYPTSLRKLLGIGLLHHSTSCAWLHPCSGVLKALWAESIPTSHRWQWNPRTSVTASMAAETGLESVDEVDVGPPGWYAHTHMRARALIAMARYITLVPTHRLLALCYAVTLQNALGLVL